MLIEGIKTDIEFLREHTLQPRWFKRAKVLILLVSILLVYFIFGFYKTVVWISIFLVFGVIVHLTYRINTHAYTRSWMDFEVGEVDGKRTYGRLGLFYYSFVVLIFLIATAVILLF